MTELDKQMEDLILDAKKWKKRAIASEAKFIELYDVKLKVANANVKKLVIKNTMLSNKIDFLENDLFALNGILLNCKCREVLDN